MKDRQQRGGPGFLLYFDSAAKTAHQEQQDTYVPNDVSHWFPFPAEEFRCENLFHRHRIKLAAGLHQIGNKRVPEKLVQLPESPKKAGLRKR